VHLVRALVLFRITPPGLTMASTVRAGQAGASRADFRHRFHGGRMSFPRTSSLHQDAGARSQTEGPS